MALRVQHQADGNAVSLMSHSLIKIISVSGIELFDSAEDFGDENFLFWAFPLFGSSTCRNSNLWYCFQGLWLEVGPVREVG